MESTKPSWYIPRASLSSGSSNSSHKSSHKNHKAKRPARYTKKDEDAHISIESIENSTGSSTGEVNQGYQENPSSISSNESSKSDRLKAVEPKTNFGGKSEDSSKRGSQSSQGSSSSNQSTHVSSFNFKFNHMDLSIFSLPKLQSSASLLLLTVANLENFAKIQENKLPSVHTFNRYTTNITTNHLPPHPEATNSIANSIAEGDQMDTVIPISELFHIRNLKAKDSDQLSIASSTHFTMVNGNHGPNKRKNKGICKRTNQISILITTMSMVFMVCILGAILFLEGKLLF